MNQVFITGATGFIGQNLVNFLAEKGVKVKALCRSEKKAKVFKNPNIKPVIANLESYDILRKNLENCEVVFHLAALAKVWDKDFSNFYKINVKATENLLEMSKEQGVKKFILTSTGGVLGPAVKEIVRENTPLQKTLTTEYEKTKAQAEKIALSYNNTDFQVVVINPTRVYGIGELSQSNAVTTLIQKYIQGKWHFLPGKGESIGNYVFVDDVVKGHYLAWQKGKGGERYILGGENVSYKEFFKQLSEVSGVEKKLYKIPLGLMLFFANLQKWKADIFKSSPLITPPFVRKYNYHWKVSSEKAERELGYEITCLKKGFELTIQWLRKLD